MLAIGSAVLTASGVLFTFAENRDLIPSIAVGNACLRVSGLAAAVGFALLVAAAFKKIQENNERAIQKRLGRRPTSLSVVYQHVPAASCDLLLFREMLVDEFGESEVASPETWQEWHWQNAQVIQVVFRVNVQSLTHKLVGGFKMVPIDGILKAKVESGEFASGTAIPVEHIVRTGSGPAAWWLGDLISTSKQTAPFVMKALRDFLLENVGPRESIFVRPLSPKGLSLTEAHGFVTVPDHKVPEIGRVCVLNATDVGDLLEKLGLEKPSRVRRSRIPKLVN